jgi:hypothetical protein
MQTHQMEAAVYETARRMDRVDPGWHKKIDEASLDMSDPHNCICGQRFNGSYLAGLEALNIPRGKGIEHGLNASHGRYGLLKNLWTKQIRLRELFDGFGTGDSVHTHPASVHAFELAAV